MYLLDIKIPMILQYVYYFYHYSELNGYQASNMN